jgi:hypothetical protein
MALARASGDATAAALTATSDTSKTEPTQREATSTTSHDVASPDADVVTAPPSQSDESLIDASAPAELAVKIYKTSILVFKDRDRYVTGEFRFRQGTCADVCARDASRRTAQATASAIRARWCACGRRRSCATSHGRAWACVCCDHLWCVQHTCCWHRVTAAGAAARSRACHAVSRRVCCVTTCRRITVRVWWVQAETDRRIRVSRTPCRS